jgi:hypothetical protein
MTVVAVHPRELRLRVDPASLAFSDTAELAALPKPKRSNRSAR